jgi:hypothetical protein
MSIEPDTKDWTWVLERRDVFRLFDTRLHLWDVAP